MFKKLKIIESPDGYFARCQWLVSKALEVEGAIVDLGCADAFMFRDVAKDRTTFVDIGVEAEKACKGLNFYRADAHSLPFPDNSFDVAVLGDMLEHVADPIKVLREAWRVCRKKLLITVPLEEEWGVEARPYTFAPHIRFYTEETLREHLSKAEIRSYELVKIRGGPWVFLAAEAFK